MSAEKASMDNVRLTCSQMLHLFSLFHLAHAAINAYLHIVWKAILELLIILTKKQSMVGTGSAFLCPKKNKVTNYLLSCYHLAPRLDCWPAHDVSELSIWHSHMASQAWAMFQNLTGSLHQANNIFGIIDIRVPLSGKIRSGDNKLFFFFFGPGWRWWWPYDDDQQNVAKSIALLYSYL